MEGGSGKEGGRKGGTREGERVLALLASARELGRSRSLARPPEGKGGGRGPDIKVISVLFAQTHAGHVVVWSL